MSMQMYSVMALFDSELREEMFLLMELTSLKHYTHFTSLHGSSEHGKKDGTVSWPGSNEILLLILSEAQLASLREQVRKLKSERKPAPGLLVFTWKLEELI